MAADPPAALSFARAVLARHQPQVRADVLGPDEAGRVVEVRRLRSGCRPALNSRGGRFRWSPWLVLTPFCGRPANCLEHYVTTDVATSRLVQFLCVSIAAAGAGALGPLTHGGAAEAEARGNLRL